MGISALLSTQILDSSATGRSVLTGADAAAIRTVLGLNNVENAAASGLYVALTGAQTVAGAKTFSSGIVPSAITLGDSTGPIIRFANSQVEVRNNANTLYDNFRALQVNANIRTDSITRNSTNTSITIGNSGFSVAGSATLIPGGNAQHSNSSGVATWLSIDSRLNQTGTAGSTDFLINRTETALGSGTHLFADFQVGGVTQFSVRRDGFVTTSGINCTGSISLNSSLAINDTILLRDAANTLAQRNGTAAQTARIYGTYTDASNYRRLYSTMTTGGAATIGVEGLGTGASGNTLSLLGNASTATKLATARNINGVPFDGSSDITISGGGGGGGVSRFQVLALGW